MFKFILNSLKQIPYIGTEILNFHCFATKMLFSFCKSIIPEDFKSAGPHLSFPGVKTRFKAFLQNIQKKNPAGLLNDPLYWTFWYLFRVWDMKSEAFHFAKSFEHSPKASKQLNYIVFNDSNVNNWHFNVKNHNFQKISKIDFKTWFYM